MGVGEKRAVISYAGVMLVVVSPALTGPLPPGSCYHVTSHEVPLLVGSSCDWIAQQVSSCLMASACKVSEVKVVSHAISVQTRPSLMSKSYPHLFIRHATMSR